MRLASVIGDDSTRNEDTRRPLGIAMTTTKTGKYQTDWNFLQSACTGLSEAFFTVKMPSDCTVYCTCKCNFTDACNKSTSSLEPILTQFSNAQRHHVHLSCMAFHSTAVCYLCADVHRTHSRSTDFCEHLLHGTGSKSDERYNKKLGKTQYARN
jgi:hypothetical protein